MHSLQRSRCNISDICRAIGFTSTASIKLKKKKQLIVFLAIFVTYIVTYILATVIAEILDNSEFLETSEVIIAKGLFEGFDTNFLIDERMDRLPRVYANMYRFVCHCENHILQHNLMNIKFISIAKNLIY